MSIQTRVRIPNDLHEDLVKQAIREHRTLSNVIVLRLRGKQEIAETVQAAVNAVKANRPNSVNPSTVQHAPGCKCLMCKAIRSAQ